MLISAKHKP